MAMAPHRASRHFLSTTAVVGYRLSSSASPVYQEHCWPLFLRRLLQPPGCHPTLCPELASKQSYKEHSRPHICRPLLVTSNDSVKWESVTELHQPLQFRFQKQLFSTKAGGGVEDKSLSRGQQKGRPGETQLKMSGAQAVYASVTHTSLMLSARALTR